MQNWLVHFNKRTLMRVVLSLSLLSALTLGGLQLHATGSVSVVRANHWVKVAKVYDGDTFLTTDGKKIRLLGINTPEIAHNNKPAQSLAYRAKKALTNWLDGQQVRLAFDAEKHDKYGRVLAQVWLADNTWVNGQLVEQGLAHVYTFNPNTKWTQALLILEKKARQNKLGLWQTQRFKVLSANKISPQYVGQFRLINGTIKTLDKHGWGFQLGSIHVSIPKKARALFQQAPSLRSGQHITVRGKIRISRKNHFFLALYAPEDLEVD